MHVSPRVKLVTQCRNAVELHNFKTATSCKWRTSGTCTSARKTPLRFSLNRTPQFFFFATPPHSIVCRYNCDISETRPECQGASNGLTHDPTTQRLAQRSTALLTARTEISLDRSGQETQMHSTSDSTASEISWWNNAFIIMHAPLLSNVFNDKIHKN